MFGGNNNYEKWPKEGQAPIEITIKEIVKIENPGYEYNFKKRGGTNTGYFYELVLDNGKRMSLNTWTLLYAIEDSGAKLGEKIRISHPKKGEWKVEKV